MHDLGEYEERPFIVMELLEGQTLKQRIGGKPMHPAEVLTLGIQLADALDAGVRDWMNQYRVNAASLAAMGAVLHAERRMHHGVR